MHCNRMKGGTLLLAVLATITTSGAAMHSRGSPPQYSKHPAGRIMPIRFVDLDESDVDLNYRLPNATEPLHYDVELTTNVHNGTKRFTGTVKILLEVIDNTNTIVLHERQLSEIKATISNANGTGGVQEQLSTSYEEAREFLSLTPTNESLIFSKGTFWVLTITYAGELRVDNLGFYLSTYTDEKDNTHYLATTQFEPTDARHAFPCFDEPAKRATFTITINHDPSLNAISNMPLDEEMSRPGYSVFQMTPSMPTYLVAFVVSDFEYTEGVLNSILQRVYTRPGTKQNQQLALVSGMLFLQSLAEYYNFDFVLPKLYQVGVPDFAAGGMENWGLVTYREEYMIYNKTISTSRVQIYDDNIIAHEHCHQWFGNLVTLKWWTYLWLKEGFANFFAWKTIDAVYPDWDVYQMFLIDDFQVALAADGSGQANPMTHYVQTPSEISARYDDISYSKAASVLYMWQCVLTDEVFRQGLNLYLTTNQYTATDESQLFEALSNAADAQNVSLPATMAAMFSSWSQQSGYPLLTVTRNYNNNTFTITQDAFFPNKNQTSDKTWYIPLNYAHKSNPDYRNTTASHFMLKTKEIEISDNSLAADDWLILNKQSTGFYRINYDEQNWNLIIDELKSRPYKFHSRNRAQLIYDLYQYTSTDRIDYSMLFNLLQYLPNEDQYAPWATTYSLIFTLKVYLNSDTEYNNFLLYVASLVTGHFEKLGLNDVSGAQRLTVLVRNLVIELACLSGVESCLTETKNKLKEIVDNGITIEPSLRWNVYCYGIRQSGDTEFDFVYNQILQSSDQAFRDSLTSTLGCSQTESQLQKFVSSSINVSVEWRSQERITLLGAVYSSSSVGLLVCIEFLNENWEAYSNLNPEFTGVNPLYQAMVDMSTYIFNNEQETKYLALLDKVKGSDKLPNDLETVAKANIQSNFDWLNENRDPIMLWMKKFAEGGSAAL
ncbi:aminopeptidase N-like [Anastrepha obliqua]|uniref:aminopeptidase N-like n=1 Tax=Anastrepha obliqua TaxID=95512 RepID=UPI00240A3BD6|nr:aminopeptidase N-like [Anastrepha obliqua]XP_054725823.1 aminopeptidase N-like [Anastrepha obliqua]XP_054725824.1 aminopeptidase N-like [Anastrepha obliqua]